MKFKNQIKSASFFLIVFSLLVFLSGCQHSRSIVQSTINLERMHIVQLASQEGDLHIWSNYYNMREIEVSLDGGDTWKNEFIISYDYLQQHETHEIRIRKKEVHANDRVFLASLPLIVNHSTLTFNDELPSAFEEIITRNNNTSLSSIARSLENNTNFLLLTKFDYGLEVRLKTKHADHSYHLNSDGLEFLLLNDEENSSIQNYETLDWVSVPVFSAYDYDLEKDYFLLYRTKQTETHTASQVVRFRINSADFF